SDIFIEPLAENAAQKTVHPDLVIDQLRFAILAFRGAQRPHAPNVRIAVNAVPCAVEKNREALLLLFCASKVRLTATFLRRAHPDPGDGRDGKQDGEPVCESLDPAPDSQM